jgi:signal recognition particle GTPase
MEDDYEMRKQQLRSSFDSAATTVSLVVRTKTEKERQEFLQDLENARLEAECALDTVRHAKQELDKQIEILSRPWKEASALYIKADESFTALHSKSLDLIRDEVAAQIKERETQNQKLT